MFMRFFLEKSLFRAVEKSDVDKVKKLLEKGANPNAVDKYNEPLLAKVLKGNIVKVEEDESKKLTHTVYVNIIPNKLDKKDI